MLFNVGCVTCEAATGPVCSGCTAALLPADAPAIAGVDVTRAAFLLDDRATSIIAALKYQRQRRIARWLGAAAEPLLPRAADVITWVPATPERRRSRGYDQAEQLARELASRSGVPARKLLVRHASDQRQTGQSRTARAKGPNLSMATRGSEFVVVVDDVITTGSSIRVAAANLRQGGAQRIVAVAAAVTPRNRRLAETAVSNRCTVPKWT